MKAPWKRINDADVYVNWVWGRERVTVTHDKWHIRTKIGRECGSGQLTRFSKLWLVAIACAGLTAEQQQECAIFLLTRILNSFDDGVDEARLEILKKFVPETLIPVANHELSEYEAERA